MLVHSPEQRIAFIILQGSSGYAEPGATECAIAFSELEAVCLEEHANFILLKAWRN